MRIHGKTRRLFVNLLRRQQAEGTLHEELRNYLHDLTERHAQNGMPHVEAERRSLFEAGAIEQVKEQVRVEWLGVGLETTLQDIRYAPFAAAIARVCGCSGRHTGAW